MNPPVFILVGPTAAGKSSLALRIGKILPIEIVSADSLLFFREMDIGTAKPSIEERKRVSHHMVDVLDPDQESNAAWYSKKAQAHIYSIFQRQKVPVVVGGAGFYLRALEHPPEGTSYHPKTSKISDEDFIFLKSQDPKVAKKIHPNDHYRIARALDLIKQGQKPSTLWEKSRQKSPFFRTVWIGLNWDRKEIKKRIHDRVDQIFESGLKKETEFLLEKYPKCRKRLEKTIGYKQTLDFLDGSINHDTMVEHTKTETRKYAKRQMTWFRKEKRIRWQPIDRAFDFLCQEVEKQITL